MRREKARINAKVSKMEWNRLAFLTSASVLTCPAQRRFVVTNTGDVMRDNHRPNNPNVYLLLAGYKVLVHVFWWILPDAQGRCPGLGPGVGVRPASALRPHSLPGAPPQRDVPAAGSSVATPGARGQSCGFFSGLPPAPVSLGHLPGTGRVRWAVFSCPFQARAGRGPPTRGLGTATLSIRQSLSLR